MTPQTNSLNAMNTDFKALCDELANTLERAQKALRFEGGCSDATDSKRRALIDRARAALAEPPGCGYPSCVDDSPDERCHRWLSGDCAGPDAALAGPVGDQAMPPRVGHVLRLAEIIREVDGNHDKGAAALAEAILSHPGIRSAGLAAVVVEPSDEELNALWNCCGIADEHGHHEGNIFEFARAVLARYGHQPAPPAEGEVGELVEWLSDEADQYDCIKQAPDVSRKLRRAADLLEQRHPAPVPALAGELLKEAAWLRNECSAENADGNWISMSIDQALDLASLLERQAAPVPVAVADGLPELRGMFERILCVARSSGGRHVGNIELADRLIKAVVSWGALPLPQGEVE